MPLDALCLTAVAAELRAAVAGGKIDKLYQPTRDEVVLYVRGQGENVRLLLSANPGHPRANLTTLNRENPEQPPMFCMLLRKHLQGARILELNQPPLERILEFRLETLDELGDRVERRLVLEAMGRSANLLLLDGEGRIIDCIRRVDGDLGRGQRQLLPGLFYRQPPAPDKLNPFTIEPEELRLVLENPLGKEWDKLLLDSFTGLSPLVARELAFRAGGDRERLAAELEKLKNNVNENGLTPYLLVREGKPVDFTVLPILQYGPETESRPQASFSQMLDEFYERREAADRVRQRGQDLVKAVTARPASWPTRPGSWRLPGIGSACGSWGTSSPPTSTPWSGGWRYCGRWTSTTRRAGRWRSGWTPFWCPSRTRRSTIRTTTRPRRRNRCSPSNWKRGRGSWST